MPEGDTVWLAGRRLHEALAGEVLLRSDFRVPQLAAVDLAGREVLDVASRGKHLLTRIAGGLTLHTHFRMDGSWHLYRPGERWRGGPMHQVRLVLETAPWQAVGYRMPVVELFPTEQEERSVGHLGPDLLGPHWGEAELTEAVRRLRARPDRELGDALLDQRNLAGVGNLYKAEVCFLCAISPWETIATVDGRSADALAGVVQRAQRLLEANKSTWHQSTTGDRRRGYDHWVFEREGRPCRRCGTRVLMATQGEAPYGRLTYWCPVCQPGPAPTPVRRADLPPPPAGRNRRSP
jgi:endonuclease-8